ncbi:MAG: hypothetical protein WD601_01280 [Pseudohongiellaceae bacterium]
MAKEHVYQDWQKAAHNVGRAADVLQLFLDKEIAPETRFQNVQEKAFKVLNAHDITTRLTSGMDIWMVSSTASAAHGPETTPDSVPTPAVSPMEGAPESDAPGRQECWGTAGLCRQRTQLRQKHQ